MKFIGLLFLIVLCLFILFIAILLFVKIKIVIDFSMPKDGKFSKKTHYEVMGAVIDGIKLKDSQNKDESSILNELMFYYDLLIKARIRKNIYIEKLRFDLRLGLGEADQTAIVTGAAWAAIYDVIAVIAGLARTAEPQISVESDFDEEVFEFDGQCIINLRLVNIIGKLISYFINIYSQSKKITKKEKAAINHGNTN